MDKFTQLTGVAAPLPAINIDTDKIIPKNYLKSIKRSGFGKHLFAEMRYNADGSEKPDFVLNKPAYRQAKILIAYSSREHAPWALLDFGVKCVIAPSFADIFYNNCFKNGVLPLILPKEICEQLVKDAERGANATMTVDLVNQTVTRPDGEVVKFEMDPFRKHCLVNGLDEVGLTMAKGKEIDDYEAKLDRSQPWLAASASGAR